MIFKSLRKIDTISTLTRDNGSVMKPGINVCNLFSSLLIPNSQELADITDESVVADLRTADRRKNYWLDEDPSLDRMLAWIRRQR